MNKKQYYITLWAFLIWVAFGYLYSGKAGLSTTVDVIENVSEKYIEPNLDSNQGGEWLENDLSGQKLPE